MNHRKIGRKLNRKSSHRFAMFRNMIISLLKQEVIKTTLPKAKELKRFIEPIITYTKNSSLANRRIVLSIIRDKSIVYKLFNNLGPKLLNKNKGGYVRIIKCGFRKGDNASLAYVQLIYSE